METTLLELEIISPEESKKLSVHWIEIESPTGSFVIGPDHIPLISIIKQKSTLIFKNEHGEEEALEVSGGIFKIIENKAFILLDQ